MVSKNTKKSASISVHGFQSYFKDDKRFNLDVISKQEAPQLLKLFLVEIRHAAEENKGKGTRVLSGVGVHDHRQ